MKSPAGNGTAVQLSVDKEALAGAAVPSTVAAATAAASAPTARRRVLSRVKCRIDSRPSDCQANRRRGYPSSGKAEDSIEMKLGTVLERNHNKAVTAPIREMPGIALAEAADHRRTDRRSPKQALRPRNVRISRSARCNTPRPGPAGSPDGPTRHRPADWLSRCTSLAQVSKPSQETSKENGQKRAMSSPARLATARQIRAPASDRRAALPPAAYPGGSCRLIDGKAAHQPAAADPLHRNRNAD